MTDERKGELFVVAGAVLWASFPVVTILSYNHLSPLTSLAWSTLIAAVFFGIIVTFKRKWHEVKNAKALKDILLASSIIGLGFYLLFFFGLKYTSAGNAAIIALTEALFSYLLFNLYHREHISKEHIWGVILMLTAACIVLLPNVTSLRIGDLLILSAAFVAPIGNFFQRRARKQVSSEFIMFGRSAVAAIGLFILIFALGEQATVMDLRQSWLVLLLSGFLLMGLSKIFWIESIHRISVTKANAVSGSIKPIVTLLLAWLILRDIPTVWQISSVIPMFFGVIFLSKK